MYLWQSKILLSTEQAYSSVELDLNVVFRLQIEWVRIENIWGGREESRENCSKRNYRGFCCFVFFPENYHRKLPQKWQTLSLVLKRLFIKVASAENAAFMMHCGGRKGKRSWFSRRLSLIYRLCLPSSKKTSHFIYFRTKTTYLLFFRT